MDLPLIVELPEITEKVDGLIVICFCDCLLFSGFIFPFTLFYFRVAPQYPSLIRSITHDECRNWQVANKPWVMRHYLLRAASWLIQILASAMSPEQVQVPKHFFFPHQNAMSVGFGKFWSRWVLCYVCISLHFILFYSLIEFIGVTLFHKTIQVSNVQLNKISSAHCTVCPLPKAKSLSIHTYPPFIYLHLSQPRSL